MYEFFFYQVILQREYLWAKKAATAGEKHIQV